MSEKAKAMREKLKIYNGDNKSDKDVSFLFILLWLCFN